MLTFLRKIRRSLIDSLTTREATTEQAGGAAWKYFLYAIGEIILVVIGIMIALYFNNLNQQRINEEKLKATLVEIQSDIVSDVIWTMHYTRRYLEKDTLKSLIFNSEITPDDLISGRIKPHRAAFRYDAIHIRSNGFDKLTLNIDDVPDKNIMN